jgi:hypothetical protein
MDLEAKRLPDSHHRRLFIGGSDARIIMGDDETALPERVAAGLQSSSRGLWSCAALGISAVGGDLFFGGHCYGSLAVDLLRIFRSGRGFG